MTEREKLIEQNTFKGRRAQVDPGPRKGEKTSLLLYQKEKWKKKKTKKTRFFKFVNFLRILRTSDLIGLSFLC